VKLHRFICILFWVAPILASGCIIQIGDGSASSGDGGGTGAGEPTPSASVLPGPDNAQGDPWSLTPEQQARKEEVERYIVENHYKGYKILRTVQDPHGSIIDWIAPETMAQLPYEPPLLPWNVDQIVLPDGVELAQSELAKYTEIFGPPGSTPIHRPMYWRYVLGETGATSVQDYLDNYQDAGQAAPETPANRLYAGLLFDDAKNRGVTGLMNQFAPRVEKDSFSLMEFAVVCQGAPGESIEEELIGIVLSVDKRNFAYEKPEDSDLVRLHVESYQRVNGVQTGGWDQAAPGFVLNSGNTQYPLNGEVTVSKPGGKPVEHWPNIVQALNGDFWVSYNGWFLGYFEASRFTLLPNGGCRAQWYLEVLDRKPGPAWVETEMGTGKFGDKAAPGEAAWVRRPMYWDMNWVLTEPPVYYGMQPVNYDCYTRSKLMDMGPGLGNFFFAGGPGGYNPLCTKQP